MYARIEDANNYYHLTRQVVIGLQLMLNEQTIVKEKYIETRLRQQEEIKFLESNCELREQARTNLVRYQLKLSATVRAVLMTEQTMTIVAGTLLQVAKQALSIRYGTSIKDCTANARKVSGEKIQEIIWYGRNQAMHFEEGKGSWTTLFEALDMVHPGEFTPDPIPRSMEIIELLGWINFGVYEDDMKKLGILKS
ncbi:hypothetical protein [Pseudomonas ovata]|uniref:hypothetical protein n=1 Tax=Pseudomonas ovata TaxID=1839709 RepID=UPI000D689126|nr:hypothetical protein [Pseudomonas ovata]